MGILDEAFASVAQAPDGSAPSADALAPAPSDSPEIAPDPLSELGTRLGGLPPAEKRRLLQQHANDVLEAEANARASKTLSRRQQEFDNERRLREYAEQMLKVRQDDYDAIEATAKQQAEAFERQMLLQDPQLQQESLTQWRTQQYAGTRQHDFFRDIPEEVWQQVSGVGDVADYYARLAQWKIDHGYVPKVEVKREVSSAEQRERARLMGTVASPDTSRSEGRPSSDDVEAQLRAVTQAVKARGGNPTRDQSALLENLTRSLEARLEATR